MGAGIPLSEHQTIGEDMRYDGFISYSHAADGRLAPALQKALQKLAKPWFRRRSLEIFRDETGLSVDPHLWKAIVTALDDSEWFVLLTSPLAAQSEWVNREIEHWKANRSVDRILPVLTDGHWEWDEKAGEFTPESDAVPPALRGVFTDEPRHLDLRWAREEQQVDLNNSRFRNAVAEIAAPLHGVTKDEIEGEDVRQHRRTVRVAWSAAASLAVLTVAAVAAGGIAVINANRAEDRRILAESQRLAAQSQTELERPDLAFLLAAQGYRLNPNTGTESALLTAVANLPEVKERIPTGGPVAAVAISDVADRVWTATVDGDLTARRFSDGEQVARAQGLITGDVVAMSKAGDDRVVVTDGLRVTTLDDKLRPTVVRIPREALVSLAVDPTTGRIAGGSVDGTVFVWGPEGKEPITTFTAAPGDAGGQFSPVTAVAWTPDGALIAASQDGGIRRYDLDTPATPVWEQPQTATPGQWASAVTVVDDGTIVTGGTDGTVGFWNGADGTLTDAGLGQLHPDSVRGLAATGYAPEEGSVASVGDDGNLQYWNHLTGLSPVPFIRVDERAATSIAWDPTNPSRGITGGEAGGVVLLDYGPDRRQPLARAVDGWSGATKVAVSPTGDRLVVAREVGGRSDTSAQPVTALVLTNAVDPDPSAQSARIEGLVESLTFTPNGELALAGTGVGTVAVWDGSAKKATVTEVARGESVTGVAVSPNGELVATGSVSSTIDTKPSAPLRLWRLEGERLVADREIGFPAYSFGLAFTPDGSRLIAGGTNQIAIYPLEGGDATIIDVADDIVRSVAVSPDGTTVAVGLWSGPVRLFELATGQPTGDDLRLQKRATDMAIRDDGRELATVSADGNFIVWDLASRSRLSDRPMSATAPDAARGLAPSLGVGPDFAITASSGDDRLVKWSLQPDDWIAEGCDVHKRELSEAEKTRFGLEGSPPICAKG
jgi:WD40 repeat protein